MKVSPNEPFQIIYSLFSHQYLGTLFESFAIQLDEQNRLTFQHQNISHKNAEEFSAQLDEDDYELIKLMDSIQQDVIIQKFYNKKITPADFFLKVYDKEKGDKILQGTINSYIETRKTLILERLGNKQVYIMGKDGEPAWKHVTIPKEKASVLFHFMKNEDNTHYFPRIRHEGERVEFQFNDSQVICNEPAWLLIDDRLYTFKKEVDGKKIKPFLNKKFILIPKSVEEKYYNNFVANIVANFDVFAKGFEINTESYKAAPILTFSELGTTNTSLSLFDDNGKNSQEEEEGKIVFDLSFNYGDYKFGPNGGTDTSVKVEKTKDSYIFHRIKRNSEWEVDQINLLRELGIEIRHGKCSSSKSQAFQWLAAYSKLLRGQGFEIKQSDKDKKKFFVGQFSIDIEVKETNDWFDIYATVRFGEYIIPFLTLKNHILKKRREFTLPNGETAIIPESWFTEYSELFAFSEDDEDEQKIKLKRHHVALVQELESGNLAKVTMDRKLENLRNFENIDDYPMPTGFKGTLRPYQKAGYNWLQFLREYKLGGCLADDMGLGKTIQTLALLQDQKEKGAKGANLLVMPTSLVYNWEMEAEKFAPELKILAYTGTNRDKDVAKFDEYDIILTSYGIIRLDIDLLKTYAFNYVILDESQAIKNPGSNIAAAVKELVSNHKLILTGTPVENSTLDLWSQMTFVNPGLLGGQRYFKNEFLNPIEKKNDEHKKEKLYSIIKPFILRRQKSQVVTELPEKIEQIHYSEMTEEQNEEYEQTKAYYRNEILKEIGDKGRGKSQIMLLQGLTKLRQIANHPRMVNDEYEANSGKLDDVLEMLTNAIAKDHKILIFSQFVKHLALVKEYLDKEQIDYAYLDGNTKARKSQVELFQNNDNIKTFLISLKAGGVGLNLTAADYVFLLDPWWNPAIEAQAVDRAHRIGQKNKVFTYKFITKGTVEEKILKLQQSKKKLADDLISTEESFIKSLSTADIEALLG